MAINTLEYASIFQKNLDLLAIQESLTGWMDANAGQVIYNGGSEVKIPKMTVDGLADYDRDAGYTQGGIAVSYQTREMTQDRGRKFQLDAMDIDETNFVATASRVMGEFSRSFFADSSIHALRFLSLLLRLLSFDFSLCILLAQAGQYFDIPELGTYSTPHTVQFLGFNAVHRFVGVICNSPTKPMNL